MDMTDVTYKNFKISLRSIIWILGILATISVFVASETVKVVTWTTMRSIDAEQAKKDISDVKIAIIALGYNQNLILAKMNIPVPDTFRIASRPTQKLFFIYEP